MSLEVDLEVVKYSHFQCALSASHLSSGFELFVVPSTTPLLHHCGLPPSEIISLIEYFVLSICLGHCVFSQQ